MIQARKNLRGSLLAVVLLFVTQLWGKEAYQAQPGMKGGQLNYHSFTPALAIIDAETIAGNQGYASHPELGRFFKYSPCRDCYEAIGARTADSKCYFRKGTRNKELLQQTSSSPMHYRDDAGNWKTIEHNLTPDESGHGFSAIHQLTPVHIYPGEGGSCSLGNTGSTLNFNRGLELLFQKTDGSISSLGQADWTHLSAGDDGVYITDAWPGIDAEIRAGRGALKTSFWIKRALPLFANGTLLVRDHLLPADGLQLDLPVGAQRQGIVHVQNNDHRNVYYIATATAFELHRGKETLTDLYYAVPQANTLDICVPGTFLNRADSSYPVIIDPLVTDSTSVSVPGSTYSPTWTVGCATNNPAHVPADLTISDIQFSFDYINSGGALLYDGSLDFWLGSCRNPASTGYYWYCPGVSSGACGGYDISLYTDFSSCVPAEQCDTYSLNITMNFYQNYASTSPCSATYLAADQPYVISVVGHTLTAHPIAYTGTGSICLGSSTTLTDSASYGKPPYHYAWYPGGATGATLTVSPTSTTTYTMVVTDSCGFTDTVTQTITVNPVTSISGPLTLCVGGGATYTNSVTGGLWSSGATSVASIGSSSGSATAIGAGSTNITYTNPYGCVSVLGITVVSSPTPISGPTSVCTGMNDTLTDGVTGGTWSSSNTSIATINGSTGILTGISPGTVTITYSISSSCIITTTVEVNLSPTITSTTFTNPTTCTDSNGTITLSGLVPGSSLVVNYLAGGSPVATTLTANTFGQLLLTGLAAGTYSNIYLSNPGTGCTSNIVGPVTLVDPPTPATPVAANNTPICAGSALNLTATCATSGVTYSWTGPASFTSNIQNPVISHATTSQSGTYAVTATLLGCVSAAATTIVTVNPMPFITNMTGTNPSTCQGSDGYVSLPGLIAGVSYSVDYTFNGAPIAATITADASGVVTITGLVSGTYDQIVVSSLGCTSNTAGPVVLKDPHAPTIPYAGSNSPVCTGRTLALYASDSFTITAWSWTGPNGFSSALQNPIITGVTLANAGTYKLIVYNGKCTNSDSTTVVVVPGITLFNVTTDETIDFGASTQLNALGATYYLWTPNDGSLSNPNINNPVATPTATTIYTVRGLNQWGCADTAYVTVSVIKGDTIMIPSAFTPNGDGLNDVFRVVNRNHCKLVDFNVFNRWGQQVYHNEGNINSGWDGTYKGVPQDIGIYHYEIIIATSDGKNTVYKGDVTLVR